METVIETLSNDNTKTHKRTAKGACYDINTPDAVVNVLEGRLHAKREARIRLDYGDTQTGQSWGEEFNIEGYVGRSTGRIPIPLLIHNVRSMGGGPILDGSIVAIYDTKSGAVLYRHPAYRPAYLWEQAVVLVGKNERLPFEVYAQNLKTGTREVVARFKTEPKARHWLERRAKYERMPASPLKIAA